MQFTQPYQQEIHIKDSWKELSNREEGKGRERNPIVCEEGKGRERNPIVCLI
jgi:hypothetical protein